MFFRQFFHNNFQNKNKQQIGADGEILAKQFLKKKGYQIFGQNLRASRWGEIDLVAIDGDQTVVVEVKTRHVDQLTDPLSSIDQRKRLALQRSTHYIIKKYPELPTAMRIDVILVKYGQKSYHIEHYVNIPILD